MEQRNAWHPCPPAGLLEIANESLENVEVDAWA